MLTTRTRRNISLVLFISLLLVSAVVWSMTADDSELKDGVFSGKAQGYNGIVTVDITITGGRISAVQVQPHEETPFIADPAIETLTADILQAQSADVDVISGATLTSNAVIAAVEQALKKASSNLKDGVYTGSADGYGGLIKVEVTVFKGSITNIVILEQDETPFIAKNALEKIPESIILDQSWDVDVVSGATVTSDAIMDAVENALAQ